MVLLAETDVVSRRNEQLCQRSTNSNITDSLFLVLPILYPFNYRIFQENTFYNWNFRTAIVLKGSGPFKLIDFLSCLRSKLLYLIAALFQTCLLKISELWVAFTYTFYLKSSLKSCCPKTYFNWNLLFLILNIMCDLSPWSS